MAISTAVKDYTPSRSANPVGAFYPIAASDWGVVAPGTTGTAFSATDLTAGAGGNLATTTAAVKVTFVTALGESLPSVEATKAVTGPTGSVAVDISALAVNASAQLNAQAIIGWNVYSGSGSGNEKLNATAAGLNGQALTTITTLRGATLTYIPIATTSVTVTTYGAGANPPVVDTSGIQDALPAITTNTTSDVFAKVPLSFDVSRPIVANRPNSGADASGVALVFADCVAPLWAASTAFNAGDYIVVANMLFQCTTAGTTSAAAAVPNFAGSTLYGTVTDNTATWTNLGRWHLARLRFMNLSGSTAQPTADVYNLTQL